MIATASGVDSSLPSTFEQTAFPLVLIGVLLIVVVRYCERVGTEVADLQTLKVAHKVLERHPAIKFKNTTTAAAGFPVFYRENRTKQISYLKTHKINNIQQ